MDSETQAETRRSQYLLGLSSEAERERLESEFFADDDTFHAMLTAEDDLIDAYVRGELPAKECKEFEKRFMATAQGRERVQFARTLAGPRAQQEVKVSTWPGFFASLSLQSTFGRAAATFASVAVVAGFLWLLVDRGRMNNELRELRAEHARLTEQSKELQRVADAERARSAELTAQLEAANSSTTKPAEEVPRDEQQRPVASEQLAAVFDLSPGGGSRGGPKKPLAVAQKTRFIQLRLGFERPSTHQAYGAVIETADGDAVWRNDSFGSRSNATELNSITLPQIPASTLRPGDYVLFLTGKRPDGTVEPVAIYSFRISRK